MNNLVLDRINAHDAAGLWALFDRPLRVEAPLAATATVVDRMLGERGALRAATRVPEDCATDRGTFLVQAERGPWKVEIRLDADGRISEMHVGDPAIPAPLGKANSDYFAYGREIVAVADGTVVTIVDGVPENVPGTTARYAIKGNYVVIRHAPKLFSLYVHLQAGRMRVKPRDSVKRGAVLGLLGNNGHSGEPHLHFQLQDGPDDNTSWGVEGVFDRVVVTREGSTQTKAGYTFWKGDRIRAPEGAGPTP